MKWIRLPKFYAVFCGTPHARLWVNSYIQFPANELHKSGERIGRVVLGVMVGGLRGDLDNLDSNIWQVSRVS